MLARKSVLTHRLGFKFETPLLIPSFSSKGFLFQKIGKRQVSEAKIFMDLTADVLTETMLVSAYDIYNNHLDPISKISKIPGLTFIDSGGYEVSDYHDFSAIFRHPVPIGAANWDEDKLKTVLDKWPKSYPAVVISFDHRATSFLKQIDSARKLFARYPDQMRDFIIKPDKKKGSKYINIDSIVSCIDELGHFDIVGVTEKELGSSVLGRMLNIAKLREAMDKASLRMPIHIFGSLDPLSSTLYFLAGAEIFDGLTWLRYSYVGGKAIYYHNYGATEYGIYEEESMVKARSLRDNIYYMKRMQHDMQNFLPKKDFSKFEFQGRELRKAYEIFEAKRGGK